MRAPVRKSGVAGEGLYVGLIAYAAVALFYAGFDLLAARGGLYTVNLLGLAAVRGIRDPAILQYPVRLDTAAILWYNGLHLILSLLIGFIVVWLLAQAGRRPDLGRPILLVIVAGFVATILAVGWLTAAIRPLLPWWSIVTANALAVLLAGGYLLRRHPGIWGTLVMPTGRLRVLGQ